MGARLFSCNCTIYLKITDDCHQWGYNKASTIYASLGQSWQTLLLKNLVIIGWPELSAATFTYLRDTVREAAGRR